jgi:hypothetical protein
MSRALIAAASLSAALFPAAAPAQPFTAAEARPMVHPADRVEILRHALPGLSEAEVETLMTVAGSQRFHAAMAYAPAAGVIAEPTVIAANYHSPEAARTAALAQCDARRQGGARCVLAIEVRPVGWQAPPLSLSADASAAFERDYRRARGPRAMAVSDSTGNWGIARGEAAELEALATCAGGSAASDCRIVLKD